MAEKYKSKVTVFLLLTKIENGKVKILLQERANTGYMDGTYDASCSGHLEEGESLAQAVVREVKEEIDINIDEFDLRLINLVHPYHENYINVFFKTEKYEGEPKIMEQEKCSNLNWFDIDNLPKNIMPRIKNVIINIDNNILYDDGYFTHQNKNIKA